MHVDLKQQLDVDEVKIRWVCELESPANVNNLIVYGWYQNEIRVLAHSKAYQLILTNINN